MQKCAVLPGKMQKSGAELGKTNVHVEVVKSTKIVMVEINKNCKALKSRAFYYNIYKIIFYIRY